MKKIKAITFFFLFFSGFVVCQPPTIKHWDKRFGGTDSDNTYSSQQTYDGGYILAGSSYSSANGDKTEQAWGSADGWIVKINSNGTKQWDKRFGGTHYEGFVSIKQTLDNGYIAAGYTLSGANGDMTDSPRGGVDFWLVKIDSIGNKIWDKRYGGSRDEYMNANIVLSSDGGYVFGGNSNSFISGDKSEDVRGGSSLYDDYWVVKIDSLGNKQWDKTFGGFFQETLKSIIQTDDGGYLLGGYSNSGISGDKTQPQIGSWDWWVVKIDSLGNKEWDKVYGTVNSDNLYSMCIAHDGNYILTGDGFSYFKIDNNGNVIAENRFMGCAAINYIMTTSDGGYLLSGTARNTCSVWPPPDKTEPNLGARQTWIVKTDSAFNKQWDKTIFSPGEDYEGKAIEVGNGCYVIACYSTSGIGGYKSQPSWGGSDYWVVKLCVDSMLSANLTKENGIGIVVYPNPFTDDIAITIEKESLKEATFAITTLEGKIIYTQHETHLANRYTKILDLRNLPSGVYFININTNNQTHTRKIIKH